MFFRDLTVMADIGFPLTAQRIREELDHACNADNIIEWAFDNGYKIVKNPDYNDFTAEANRKYKWTAYRTETPYCDYKESQCWRAPTAKEAITLAYTMLEKTARHEEEFYEYRLNTPPWIKR